MAYSVFISHSTKDSEVVKKISNELSKYGITTFVASDNLPVGASLSEGIKNNILQSDLFLLLWSKNAKKSEWVTSETVFAQSNDILIYPVILDKDLPLPVFLKDMKYLVLDSNSVPDFEKISSDILLSYEKKNKKQGLVILGAIIALIYLLINSK